MTRLRTLAAVTALLVALLATGCVTPFDGGTETATPAETPEGSTPTADASPTPTATQSPPPAAHVGYDQTTVTVVDAESGAELGSVRAAIADNHSLRYTGLSDTEELPEDRGMLFTYTEEDDRTFVMREMDFGIDIVYVAADGTITSIHHAPAPGPGEDGNDHRYPGTGQYVLEVTYEWTADRGVEVGDRVEFDLSE